MKKFKEYTHFDLSAINKEMLQRWQDEDLFHKSIDERAGAPAFVFFEGPPSANGMPGIHHVMARTIKDTFCRYKTMQGFQVRRKAGWDTHGLPVELGVEKMLGITKEDIGKKISVDDYNAACRREVMKYTKEWTSLTQKMGYWVDLENPYITYDNKYIETLWYLLKELYHKGLLYKGYTIQPYSPAAGTGLSSHELNQPGCYRDVKDTTCTAQFKLKGNRFGADAYCLAWTTTPWTLPSNTALCVGPKIDYVAVKGENPYTKTAATYILAEARLSAYAKELGEQPDIVWRGKGTDLVGEEYEQLIPWVNPGEGAFRVIAGDYVTTDDGTGIVHIAPTFGADDAFVAKKAGVPGLTFLTKKGEIRPMVDMTGKFFVLDDLDDDFVKNHINIDLYQAYAGRFVKNAYDPNLTDKDETLDIALCMMLKQQGLAFRIEKHVHNYPHCWRTDKPVLYYPLDSWFIKTTAVKDEMIALNKTINWKPESTGTGRFGQWLNNLNDWNLSRSRYWGTPLPIWRTDDGQEEICIGSIEELFEEIEKSVAAGFMKENPWPNFRVGDYSKENYDPKNIDLHRPYVDNIVLVSASGKPMHRELDLIDVWFDSGAMPYAQVHYPFEAPNSSGGWGAADFISEGVDQTRGWFFTLHAIHTMIENRVAFKNVISNGLVLDKNGNKMSKRLGNAVDPFITIEKYGSDPLRWYMMTNASPWDNLKFDTEGVEEVRRKFFGTLYNTYSFFALYANVDGFTGDETAVPVDERPEIDRWILSLLNTLIKDVTEQYENYEPTRAGRAISDFVQENLSNWYVRLNRKRFWGGTMDADKLAAYQTLYECLVTVSRLMAPIAPFYADQLYRDLTGDKSVHLAAFPVCDADRIDTYLEGCMQLAQQATSMILALRKKANKKVRQPLQKAVVPVPNESVMQQLQHVADLVKTEVNIKELQIVTNENSTVKLVKRIKPNFKTLGKKYGKQMKEIAAAIAALTQDRIADIETRGQIVLSLPSGEVEVELADVEIATEDMPGWLVANEGNLTVALDIEVTDELRQEGIARELVNRIQNLRKSNGYEITDKIAVTIESNNEVNTAVANFKDYIAAQVLAQSLIVADKVENPIALDFEDFVVNISIEKV
ncbi:MAG: isoleucine--tRNA ligase [Bacteroidales bacterium]|nr:isoleucine--tRNA ligase [Bacteroidales bacterium]MDY6035995.1 isoleucine--tRNA ligase [Paludibacteraceae bacterium]